MFGYSTVALMGPNEDLEIQRRSLAMLTPGARSDLSREEAISLIEEVQGARKRIVELDARSAKPDATPGGWPSRCMKQVSLSAIVA